MRLADLGASFGGGALGPKLWLEALLEDGGAQVVRRYQKRPHVDSLRGATQRILVSVQKRETASGR